MFIQQMKLPLSIQFLHIVLAALWNIYGVYLISNGQPSQGPTASLAIVGVLAVFAVLFYVGAKYSKVLYIIVAVVALVSCLPAITGAFYKDPALWTSPAWRWGGVVLNFLGVLGAVIGIRRIWSLSAK